MPIAMIGSLTPREREILTHIAEGDSLAEIAQKLSRSLKTIESHRLSIGRKLNASNRVELTKIAIAGGLIKISDDYYASGDSQGSEEALLALINPLNESLGTTTGLTLLERFVVAASQLDTIRFATVCTPAPTQDGGEPDPLRRMTVAIAERGALLEPLKYEAGKTAFMEVFEQGQCLITHGIREAYPDDPFISQIEGESYLGVQLVNSKGQVVGGAGLIGCERMTDPDIKRQVIKFFSPRLAGALESSLHIKALRARLDQLELQATETPPSPFERIGDNNPKVSMALAHVMCRVQASAGSAFLRQVIDVFCETFGLTHAGICRLESRGDKEFLQSIVFRVDGGLDHNVAYEAIDTPCRLAMDQGCYQISCNADKIFPKDDMLVKDRMVAYVGVRLSSPDGQALGIFWLGSREEIEDTEIIMQAANYFAPRIGSELHNQLQLEQVMLEKEAMEVANQS